MTTPDQASVGLGLATVGGAAVEVFKPTFSTARVGGRYLGSSQLLTTQCVPCLTEWFTTLTVRVKVS